MQFRIVFTAGMSILLLGKKVSGAQWVALLVVMVGAMLKEIPNLLKSTKSTTTHLDDDGSLFSGYAVILVQLAMSTLAGVFNEKLLKSDASPNVQNIYMYLNSVWVNLVFSLFVPASPVGGSNSSLLSLHILPVIINASCLGVLTGFFLKHLSSVLKSIASAVELWVTAVVSAMVFGYAIDAITILGIAIVSVGIYLYSLAASPVKPVARDSSVDAVEMGKKGARSSSASPRLRPIS